MSRPPTRVAERPAKVDVTEKRKGTYSFAQDTAAQEAWKANLQSTSQAEYGASASAALSARGSGSSGSGAGVSYAQRKADASRTHFSFGNHEGDYKSAAATAFSAPGRAEKDAELKFADSRKSQLWASETDVASWKHNLQSSKQAEYAAPPSVKYEKVHKVHTESTAFAVAENAPKSADQWATTNKSSYTDVGKIEVNRVKKVHTESHISFGNGQADKGAYMSSLKADYSPVKFA